MMGHFGLCLFDKHPGTPDLQSNYHIVNRFGSLRGLIIMPQSIPMVSEASLNKDTMVPQVVSSYRNFPVVNEFLHNTPLL